MISAAVIGCGRMGGSSSERLEGQVPNGWLPISHIEALSSIDDIQVEAICDLDLMVLDECKMRFNIKKSYMNYCDLIDNVKPEILTVATRTHIKKDIIKYACENGVKGLYVEKPLANSIASCKEILLLVKKANVKLVYGVNRRYHSVYRYAKKLVDSNEIGSIVEICIEHGHSQLLWTHPHSVDLILFFLGGRSIQTIQASLSPKTVDKKKGLIVDSDPIVDHCFFTFESNVTAIITKANGLNVKISGSNGNMVIHGNGATIQLNKKDANDSPYFLYQRTFTPDIRESATVTALKELVSSVLSGSVLPIQLEEIETGIQMLLGCVWSHINDNKPVGVNQIPKELVVTGKYGDLYA